MPTENEDMILIPVDSKLGNFLSFLKKFSPEVFAQIYDDPRLLTSFTEGVVSIMRDELFQGKKVLIRPYT